MKYMFYKYLPYSLYKSLKSFKLHLEVFSKKELKSVIGSGGIYQKEWIPTGIETINVSDSKTWSRFFKPNSLSAILGEHIWEHLSIEEAELALENCYRFLNKGGYVRIAVPDGFHPDPKYIKGCGSIGPKEEH